MAFLLLSLSTQLTFADNQSLGRVRVSNFICPRQVAPGRLFSTSIDVEYEVRTSVSIRTAIIGGAANTTLWQSDTVTVSGGGDKVWSVNITAPLVEGALELTAFAYYLQNGVWKTNNDTILGPGFRHVFIKIAKNANLTVQLGIAGVEVKVGNTTQTTSQTGQVTATIPVGTTFPLSVAATVNYRNATRLRFNEWRDGNNQTERLISIDGDTQLAGSYSKQYLLEVVSNVPSQSYQKWYDSGASVSIREADTVPFFWPLDLLGMKYTFTGWSGDVNSGSAVANLTMKSPTTVHANFSIVYGPEVFFVAIVVIGIAVEIVILLTKRRRTAKVQSVSLESDLTCPNCGKIIEEGWNNCIHCGSALPSKSE